MTPDRIDPTPDATPPGGRRRFDAWEAVVRQELLNARRGRSPRLVADEEGERAARVVPDPQPGGASPEAS